MFWNIPHPNSNIESLLEKEDFTLHDLLNEDDILQECKGQNSKLIEFLCKKEVIEDLVEMITVEPAEDEDETVRYKFPNLACELLTSDVPQINNTLGDSEVVRKKLFGFLDKEPPVNPLLASFFSKVVGILLSRKPEPTLEYIKGQEDFLASVLKHLGTSAIMDLLLRMVTCVEAADLRAQVLNWLNENHLVQRLIGLIDPAFDEELHCNSAQSLCDIIRLSREHMYTMQESAQEDPLLNTLEREETVSLLLRHMFDGEIVESVIVNGISVLLALLEIRRPAPFGFPDMAPELTQLDVERLARGVSRTLHGVSGRLADFHKLLINPPKKDVMKCTFGDLEPPLGNTRLHVGKLLSAILMTNTHNINSQLADLKIFDSLLDLFFKYEYNNFLHTQVAGCIQTVLGNSANVPPALPAKHDAATTNQGEGSTQSSEDKHDDEEQDSENPRLVAPLLAHLFEECRLIQRIMDAWEDNSRHENEDGGHRKGNMGHLTVITNCIVENIEKGTNCERLKRFLGEMPEEDQGRWQKFLTDTLSDMNERNSRELGGHNPLHFSSDEENEDFRDVPFNTDSSLQQGYTDYQLQQMTSNFIDQFGFTDEDFAEPDDNIKFDKIESIDFDIKGDTNAPSEQLFEAVCKARVAHLDDNFGEDEEEQISDHSDDDAFVEDARGSPRSKPVPTVTVRHGGCTDSTDSEDSDEGQSPAVTPIKIPDAEEWMDTSQSPGWKANFEEPYDTSSSSSSSSNSSTPTSSPRLVTSNQDKDVKSDYDLMDIGQEQKPEEAISSSEKNEGNWADFDKFCNNVANAVCRPASEEKSSPSSSSLNRAEAYLADSTSAEPSLEDLSADSPMAVAYTQHSPSETAEIPSASSTMETQNLSQESATVSSSDNVTPPKPGAEVGQDVVMDDVSSTPDFQLETVVQSSSNEEKEPTSSGSPEKAEISNPTPSVAMETDLAISESGGKRQRMEGLQQEFSEVSSRVEEDLRVESTVTISASEVRASSDLEAGALSTEVEEISSSSPTEESPFGGRSTSESLNPEDAVDKSDLPDTAGEIENRTVSMDPITSSSPEQGVTETNPVELSQSLCGSVQHNEVSSSSSFDTKLANATGSNVDLPEDNPPTEMKHNGPV